MTNNIREKFCKSCNRSKNIEDSEEEFKYKKNNSNFIEGYQNTSYSKLIVNPNDMDEAKVQKYRGGGKIIVNPRNMDEINAQKYRSGKIIVNPSDIGEVNDKKVIVNNNFWSVGVL